MASDFQWTPKKNAAAVALAEGKTQLVVADEVGVTDRTIRNWLAEGEFSAEVDRLSLMVGIASRAERLRLAKRVIRSLTDEHGNLATEKDALEWLKFAQSETDGIKLDIAKVAAALSEDETPVAGGGSTGSDQAAKRD